MNAIKFFNLTVINRYLYFLLFSLLLFFISSCNDNNCPTCYNDDNSYSIHGSGNITTDTLELPQFNSIDHLTVGTVNITYGDVQSVQVSCDDNIHDYIVLEVINKDLKIYTDSRNGLSNFKLTIDITMTEVKSLSASSAGSIKSKNTFYADKVYLYLNSAGNIFLDLNVDELYSNVNSAGNLFVRGVANKHFSSVNSAGNMSAFSLETDSTIISLSSAGSAEVYVKKYLRATLSSIGCLYYIGHPVIEQHVSSLGSIIDSN